MQPFFVCILLNDKLIARILQLQCLLFGEIVSSTVEDGSLARTKLILTLRQLELISLPFGSNSNSNSNWFKESVGLLTSVSEHSSPT